MMIPCPVCKRQQKPHTNISVGTSNEFCMRVMNAPEGGQIWHCYHCNGTWDSIEMLAEVNHSGDVREAISAILRDPDHFVPYEQLGDNAIDRYMYRCIAYRKQVNRWSSDARKQWTVHRDLHSILAEAVGVKVHLMETSESASKHVGRWMHATTREDISAELNNGLPPGLSPEYYRTCLALPWSDAPGRISALWLLGWRKQSRMWFPRAADNSENPGVMLMDCIPQRPVRIIAVSSPYLALWLQYKHFMEDEHPLPVVVWHEDTDPDIWEQFGAQEIVFWDYSPTPGLFKQALHARGEVKISYLDNPAFDISRCDKSIEHHSTWQAFRNILDVPRPSHLRLNDFTNRLRDPYLACRDYLFSLEPENVAPAMEIVKLNADQVRRLLEVCPDYETRFSLERLLEHSVRRREEQMLGGTVSQYIGPHEAYWSVRRRGREEKISDAVVQLEQVLRDEESETSFYTGVVHYRGKRYPVSTTYKDLRFDPVKVIVEAVEREGGGTPYVSSTQPTRLWDLMMRFSNIEKTVPAVTRVGWDKDYRTLLLPNFIIRSGALEKRTALGLGGDVLPLMRVELDDSPNENEMDSWLEPTDCNGAIWAVLASIADNVLGRLDHEQPRGVGLLGPLVAKAAEKVASDLGLLMFNHEQVRHQFEYFEKAQRDHDFPVLVQDTVVSSKFPDSVATWMLSPNPKNVLMTMSSLQVTAAQLCGNWTILDTGSDDGDYYRDASAARLLIHYLAFFQQQVGRREKGRSPVHASLNNLRVWADSLSKRDTTFVFNYADAVIRDAGRESGAARFIFMLAQLLYEGAIKRMYSSALDEKINGPEITVDSNNDRVFVSKQKIVETLAKKKLPALDTSSITAALAEEDALLGEVGVSRSVWAIRLKYWDEQMAKWNAVCDARLT